MENFVLAAIVLAAAAYLGWLIWGTIFKDKGCQCSSGDCCGKGKDHGGSKEEEKQDS
ncbi:hypothetical protein HSX37_10365|uniref:Uncharacterized protein n=1 Tax=Dendrosporobacter quercicolus TaxID=146817 RepID=A0A1G9R0J2_9FIRM|nr:hypothetical protein [Dendrosporobacter quercicolus]NSL48434.1 hypothetical protein [Dendrosporobacter quercicolus DSM 1736]SDM16769.1 hypothetical protein SAMN04488502_102376 [Dendrosporobacter quercicolus]